MATGLDGASTIVVDVFLEDLTICKEEIVRKFEELEIKLNERKQVLLGELCRIQERYEKSLESKNANEKLEKKTESVIEGEITVIEPNMPQEIFENIHVSFNDEFQLITSIENYGKIFNFNKEMNYQERSKPFLTLRPSLIAEFSSLFGVAIDANGNIFTADRFSGRILTISPGITKVSYIKNDHLRAPYGLCVRDNSLFVTDALNHKLLMFECNGTFVREIGKFGYRNNEFKYPYSLDIDSENDLFVCDNDNNRVSVFNTDLQWQRTLKHYELTYPRDIKVKEEHLFVLCGDKNVYIFSKQGKLMRRMCSISKFVNNPFWLCLDENGMILISDREGNAIKVFTPEGKLDYILGSELQKNGLAYCHNSQGIIISSDRSIVSVSSGRNMSLQYF